MPLYSHQYYREKASSLIKELGLNEPPIGIEQVAGHLGLEIVELSTPDWFSGVLLNIDEEFCIVVNSTLTPEQKNFTIAHEIGHHQLHREELCYLQNEKKMHLQKEADIFAEELLMPSHLVEAEAKRWFNDSGFIAKLFKVREDVMAERMKALGLLKKKGAFSEYKNESFRLSE